MMVYPAIDLKRGLDGRCRCVRLRQGRADAETEFSDDPASVARRWAEAGADWLHVVDLDGAFEGRPVNADTVREIAGAVADPHPSLSLEGSGIARLQVGGGIRDDAAAEGLLDGIGVARVVVGTRGLEDPEWLRGLCRRYPGRIAGGIDARDGRVAVEGWTRDSGVDAVDAARALEGCGVAAVVFTDIATDGMMRGPNIEATARMAAALSAPVIASGGVSTLEDVRRLAGLPIEGMIIGRALYDGTVDLGAALRVARGG